MKRLLLLLLLPSLLIGEETVVESNEAAYNGETIVLTGDVRVENALGIVTADRAVLTRDEQKKRGIDFPWIELTKSVTVTLPDGNRLHCERVFLDYTKMTSTFTGSPQIRYIDERGEVLSDRATIDYREAEGSLQPTKVTLLDNVQLIYSENAQYALADMVTYYPDDQVTILEGRENRVLFFDKKRNMQLSARQVRAIRDPETKKDAIEGVGDVRFVFGQDEMSKLRDRFKW